MTTTAQRADRDAALDTLHGIIKPGDTLNTLTTHTASSGMSRRIRVLLPQVSNDGRPYIRDITSLVARATGSRVSKVDGGIIMGGWGMDFGFSIVYSLGHTMFPDGFKCVGNNCPSNDHSNHPSVQYAGKHHASGGYALSQSWV